MITAGTLMQTSIDDLRERVDIMRATQTRDAYGNVIRGAPAVVASCWAKVLPSGSLIRDGYSETVNQVNYRIVVRYRTDIKPTDTVSWRGKILTMTAPPYDAESRHVWTVIECKELIEDESAI